MPSPSRTLALALMAGSLTLPLAGCTQVEESESTYSPTSVKPVKGQDDIQQVTFTAVAARRAGVRTATVRASGRETSIPYAALIYNEDGDTFTYVSTKPLVYLRERIDVDRIAGGRVLLRHGPPIGGRVVTTGAAEVYSAEFGVEE
jgi:multidrug efflux pump subunit AcrA (membrane-fusion protein)